MRKYTLFIALLCSGAALSAQTIVINETPAITRMMELYVAKNKDGGAFDGYRIQLAATTDRKRLDDVEATFKSKYPEVFIGWIHVKPYYKARAGAFSSRNDAGVFLRSIKNDFPDAYIVPDKVKQSEMAGNLR